MPSCEWDYDYIKIVVKDMEARIFGYKTHHITAYRKYAQYIYE
jgi:hypothetical protein